MDEELKTLEVQLETMYGAVKTLGKFDQEIAAQFLETFEEYEITSDNFLSVDQYHDFMILYFVTNNWKNPAKFLWKRIPSAMKKDKALIGIWDIGKLLFTDNYQEAAKHIRAYKKGPLSDFLQAGYHCIMNGLINEVYENIDDATYRLLMGFKNSKEQKEYIEYYNAEIQPKSKICVLLIFFIFI